MEYNNLILSLKKQNLCSSPYKLSIPVKLLLGMPSIFLNGQLITSKIVL